jgi:hypothetical protein
LNCVVVSCQVAGLTGAEEAFLGLAVFSASNLLARWNRSGACLALIGVPDAL